MEKLHSVELLWEGKGNNDQLESKEISKEREYIFPCPFHSNGTLFAHEVEKLPGEEMPAGGRVIQGDNLDVLKLLKTEGYQERIDLIYIDPPYLSQKKYYSRITLRDRDKNQIIDRPVFKDSGEDKLDQYLNDLYIRLRLMKKLLSPQGSILVHLDWHVSHYVKILLDEVFGSKNFINEIVWCYGGGSGSRRHFHRKHDLIFWYGRGENYIFNPQYRPYSRGTVERGLTRVKGDKYSLNQQGALMQDWWTDINKILSPTAYENLKFPTQKPRALLKRLIASASNPGSIVADFYAGSGTTADVCEEMNRQWIICDNSPVASSTVIQRLVKTEAQPFVFDIINTGQEKNNNNELKVRCSTEVHNTGQLQVDIQIMSYTPDRGKLEEIDLNVTFAAFIQLWEVDLNYQGASFHSHIQIIREKIQMDDSLLLSASILIPWKESGAIAVRVYDIFGDCCTRVFPY
jgi:site-specific DNA-methyltransferase (adenine-specific)